jgi:hypothetical protein
VRTEALAPTIAVASACVVRSGMAHGEAAKMVVHAAEACAANPCHEPIGAIFMPMHGSQVWLGRAPAALTPERSM